MLLYILCCQSHSFTIFTEHLQYVRYSSGGGWDTVVTGHELDVCANTHAHIYINMYMCTHILFFLYWRSECYFQHLFLYRFGTDLQMINFTTGEFQLTKACPYRVGYRL